jgi:hypothetical protein
MDPAMSHTAAQWMQLVSIGALFGLLGQAIRVIPGLKKSADQAAEGSRTLAQDFEPSRLVISLLIGAVAGVLGAISMGVPLDDQKIASATILALLGVGYSGADFIEAFMARHVPKPAPLDNTKSETGKGSNGAVG